MMTPSPNPDLSAGVKAAIGVVVPLFVLAVVGLAVFFILNRRKGASQTQQTSSGAEGNKKKPVRAELPGSGVETGYASANVQELASRDWWRS